MTDPSVIDRVRAVATRWRTVVALACNAVLCEVGARIGLPGVDGSRVHEFFQTHGGLLALYDLFVGGAIARAAVLALGAIPYLQAQFYVWLARTASLTVRQATAPSAARRTAVRLTTIGLALVQSFGFARFLQGIPGAVAEPGPGFISRTVLLVTGGAVVIGWLGDVIVGSAGADVDVRYAESSDETSATPQLASSTAIDGLR